MSKEPTIIGFTGLAGSGKSTAAQILDIAISYETPNSSTILKFAEPIKRIVREFGVPHEHLEGPFKEVPSPVLYGKSPRELMQLVGTDFGRNMIHPEIWTDLFKSKASMYLWNGVTVICDDVRFQNEAKAIRELGGVIVRIERSEGNAIPHYSHESENQVVRPDYTIMNDSLHNLEMGVRDVYSKL